MLLPLADIYFQHSCPEIKRRFPKRVDIIKGRDHLEIFHALPKPDNHRIDRVMTVQLKLILLDTARLRTPVIGRAKDLGLIKAPVFQLVDKT